MTNPSWQDYGTYDESEHARLWDGVVGAWCPSLGPTGSRLHDHSRFNNWGTLTNMDNATDWVVDGGQYALDFDGSDDYVLLGDGTKYNFERTDIFSMSAWINPASVSGIAYGIIDKTDLQLPNQGWSLVLFRRSTLTASAVAFFAINTEGAPVKKIEINTPAASIVANKWQHIAVTYAGTSTAAGVEIYIDGKQQAKTVVTDTLTGSIANGSVSPIIGGRDIGTGQMFPGQIGEATIWQRALTANEVRDLYLLGRGGMYQRRRRSRRRAIEQAVSGVRRRRILCGDYS